MRNAGNGRVAHDTYRLTVNAFEDVAWADALPADVRRAVVGASISIGAQGVAQLLAMGMTGEEVIRAIRKAEATDIKAAAEAYLRRYALPYPHTAAGASVLRPLPDTPVGPRLPDRRHG